MQLFTRRTAYLDACIVRFENQSSGATFVGPSMNLSESDQSFGDSKFQVKTVALTH